MVIDALLEREEVDPSRIGGLGICASAGYMAEAAASHPDMRALALVAPWLHDQQIVEQVYGGKEGVARLIAQGREVEQAADPVIIEAASTTNEQSLMYQIPYYTETDRGAIAAYDNKFNIASWEPWLRFNALTIADRLTVGVHSQAAAIPHGAEAFAEKLGILADMHWLEGVSQFDFYDRPAVVTEASDLVASHFQNAFTHRAAVASIQQATYAMANLVDLNEFKSLEEIYTDVVRVDYSDLGAELIAKPPTCCVIGRPWSLGLMLLSINWAANTDAF